jgi:hypothetical protein
MQSRGVWWGLVVLWAGLVLAPDTLMLPPRGLHQWRQADALSQTLNYFGDGMRFWEPAIHLQHGVEGKGAGEFPILYYMNAALWKLGGEPLPWTLRWTNLLFWLAGLTALRGWLARSTGNGLLASTVAAFLLLSPLTTYYGPNSLVNISALGCVFLGWAAVGRWSWDGQSRGARGAWWWGAVTALSMAVLLRPTMVLGLIPLAWPFWLRAIRRSPASTGAMGFWGPRLVGPGGALLLLVPVVLGGSWVLWAKSYNAHSGSVYFLTTFRPVWATADPTAVWATFKTLRLPQLYHRYTALALCILGAGAAIFLRARRPEELRTPLPAGVGPIAGVLSVALCVYFALWFKNFREHDYYLMEVHLLTPWLLVALLWPVRTIRVAQVGVALVFIGQTLHTTAETRIKLDPAPPRWIRPIVGNWAWQDARRFQAEHAQYLEPLERLAPELDALGVGPNDLVLSLPDPSPNITLTMLRRKGFTGLYEDHLQAGARAQWAADQGARFLIINRPDFLDRGDWGAALDHPVAAFGSTRIYRLDHLTAAPP